MARSALSPLDSAFLFFERPHQRLHIGCVAEIDGRIDFARLVEVLRERIDALPRFRTRPVRGALDLTQPAWEEDPTFALPAHVHHVHAPPPGDESALREVAGRIFSTPLDPARPLWEAYLIDGLAGGRSAMLWKIHHCMLDGVSGAEVLVATTDDRAMPEGTRAARARGRRNASPDVAGTAAATRARAGGSGSDATSAPARASSGAAAERPGILGWARSTAGALGVETVAEIGRTALEATSTFASLLGMAVDPPPVVGRLSGERRLAWASFSLDDVLAIRGAAECKVNDVVLAVIAGALHRYLEGRGIATSDLRMRAFVPVSVRTERERTTLGNLVSGVFPTLPIDTSDALTRLHIVAREMRDLKARKQARATGGLIALLGVMPTALQSLVGRLAPEWPLMGTVCTNVPGPREPRYLLGKRISAVHPMVPLAQSMGIEFGVLSYAGRLSIAATVDPSLVPQPERITRALEEEVEALRRAFGLSAEKEAESTRCGSASEAGPLVEALMSSPPVSVTAQETLLSAYRLMRERRIRHLPVVDAASRVVGIVTHRDLVAAAKSSLDLIEEQARIHVLGSAEVGEVMETHVVTAAAGDFAAPLAHRMVEQKIGCVPIVGAEGTLVGIVTETDFVCWAARQMERTLAAASPGMH